MCEKSCFIYSSDDVILNEKTELNTKKMIRILITKNNVNNFYFNDTSPFVYVCLEIINYFKAKYPDITTTLVEDNFNIKFEPSSIFEETDFADFFHILINDLQINDYDYLKDCYIIDQCDYFLYFENPYFKNNHYKLYTYAKSKEKCKTIVINKKSKP